MKLSSKILDCLRDQVDVDSAKNEVRFPREIEPETFSKVVAIFQQFGAKYRGNHARKTGRYVFPSDPGPIIKIILSTGEANPLAFFATPEGLADYMASVLDLENLPPGGTILEPNYGTGALVSACLRKLVELGRFDVAFHCVEVNGGLVELAERRKMAGQLSPLLNLYHADFTTWRPPFDTAQDRPSEIRFDRVIMNPPFTETDDRQSYIWHITRAFGFLKPKGRLVGLTPPWWAPAAPSLPLFIDEAPLSPAEFRAWVEAHGSYVRLKPGLFRSAGTFASTILVALGREEPVVGLPSAGELQEPAYKRGS